VLKLITEFYVKRVICGCRHTLVVCNLKPDAQTPFQEAKQYLIPDISLPLAFLILDLCYYDVLKLKLPVNEKHVLRNMCSYSLVFLF